MLNAARTSYSLSPIPLHAQGRLRVKIFLAIKVSYICTRICCKEANFCPAMFLCEVFSLNFLWQSWVMYSPVLGRLIWLRLIWTEVSNKSGRSSLVISSDEYRKDFFPLRVTGVIVTFLISPVGRQVADTYSLWTRQPNFSSWWSSWAAMENDVSETGLNKASLFTEGFTGIKPNQKHAPVRPLLVIQDRST